MNRKRLNIFLIAEGVVCLIAFFLMKNNTIGYNQIVTFPFVQIGHLIRSMSLHSSFMNILAWAVYIVFCAVPLIILGIRIYKKKHTPLDILLAVVSVLMFICMYYMINPGLADGVLAPAGLNISWQLGFPSTIYIILVGYVIMRLINRFQAGEIARLLGDLNAMLIVFAAVLVFVMAFAMPFEIVKEIKTIEDANTMEGIGFTLTHTFVVLRNINKMLPVLFQILIVLAGLDLVRNLKDEIYSKEVVIKAAALVKRCKQAIVITVASSIVVNILQLMANSRLLHSDYQLDIPLTSMLIVIITMLLAKYFANSLKIKKEMDLFI